MSRQILDTRYKIQDIANEPRAGRMGDTTLAVLRGCAVLDRPMEPRRACLEARLASRRERLVSRELDRPPR